jgi:hypothetical protein
MIEKLREIVGKMTAGGHEDHERRIEILGSILQLASIVPELLDVVEAATALADVLGDRREDRLKANERHWHEALRNKLDALRAKVEP